MGLVIIIPAQSHQTQAQVDSGQHRRFLGSLVNDAGGLFNGLVEMDNGPIEEGSDAKTSTSAKKSSGILGNVQGAVKKFIPL